MEAVVLFVGKFGKKTFGDDRLRAKRHLPKKSRRDKTCLQSARKSTSTSASGNRDADREVGATLIDRELYENVSSNHCVMISGNKLMKMNFVNHDVIANCSELTVTDECVHKLFE